MREFIDSREGFPLDASPEDWAEFNQRAKDADNPDTHTICPEVNGVRHLSDIECFQCFNIEIDEFGHNLWGFRKIQDKTVGKRIVPKHDDLPGDPGSKERIEFLRGYYENDIECQSPFVETTTENEV